MNKKQNIAERKGTHHGNEFKTEFKYAYRLL